MRTSALLLTSALVGCVTDGLAESVPTTRYCVPAGYTADAVQDCVDAVAGADGVGGTVALAAGTYWFDHAVVISHGYTRIVGAGRGATMVAAANPAITLWHYAGVNRTSLESMLLYTSPTGVTAVRAFAVTEWTMRDVTITGNFARGLRIHGHDAVVVDNVFVQADRPLYVGLGLLNAIALDHGHFSDLQLIEVGNDHPVVEIEPAAAIQDVTFDGYQAWIGGSYGLHWGSDHAVAKSTRLTLRNVRREQAASTGATIAVDRDDWSHLDHFVCDGCTFAYACDGYELAGVYNPVIRSSTYDGAPGKQFGDSEYKVASEHNVIVERP